MDKIIIVRIDHYWDTTIIGCHTCDLVCNFGKRIILRSHRIPLPAIAENQRFTVSVIVINKYTLGLHKRC